MKDDQFAIGRQLDVDLCIIRPMCGGALDAGQGVLRRMAVSAMSDDPRTVQQRLLVEVDHHDDHHERT